MTVSTDDVLRVAALARIGVPAGRVPALARELSAILEHMQVLQRIESEGAARDAEDAGAGMPLGADAPPSVALACPREALAPHMLVHGVPAPSMREGFYLVPRLATHEAAGDEP